MSTLIHYHGELVAVSGATRFYPAPRIRALATGDPLRAIVGLMCVYAQRVHSGRLSGPYTDQDAERYARSALIDDDHFTRAAAAGLDDDRLAERFNVPPEQIQAKRRDLGA